MVIVDSSADIGALPSLLSLSLSEGFFSRDCVRVLKNLSSIRFLTCTNSSGEHIGFEVKYFNPTRYCIYGFSLMVTIVSSSLRHVRCFIIKAPITKRAGLLPAPDF